MLHVHCPPDISDPNKLREANGQAEGGDPGDRDQTFRELRGQGEKEFIEAEAEMGKKAEGEILLRKGEKKEMEAEKGSDGIRMA